MTPSAGLKKKPPYRRVMVFIASALILGGAVLMALLAMAREELRFMQLQQLTQGGRDIDEWHASFQRFAQNPVSMGKLRFGYQRGGGGNWSLEERRDGRWVERPLANADFRYWSDPTIRVPNDLTNEWRLKVSSSRNLVLGFGTNTWTLSKAMNTLRSETLPALSMLKSQASHAPNSPYRPDSQ